jgi:hypothetical protein
VISDGTLEALKYVALVLMVLDHVNKFMLAERSAVLFDLGRMVMPIFGFVLAYNLSRPGALESGVHRRIMARLLAFGIVATPMFVVMSGWWPLNILFMLLVFTAVVELVERGGVWRDAAAVMLVVVGGALVEFWWFGLATCLAAWAYCRRPDAVRLALWIGATASLAIVNRNFAALAAIALLLCAPKVDLPIARSRWLFYAAYPIHLAIILVVQLALRP